MIRHALSNCCKSVPYASQSYNMSNHFNITPCRVVYDVHTPQETQIFRYNFSLGILNNGVRFNMGHFMRSVIDGISMFQY